MVLDMVLERGDLCLVCGNGVVKVAYGTYLVWWGRILQ